MATVQFGSALFNLFWCSIPPFPLLLLLISPHSSIVDAAELDSPLVQTRNGPVKGFRIDLEPPALLKKAAAAKVSQADVFLGIPFAEPPVDGLRLERPKQVANWTDTLEAVSIPPACVPQHVLAAPDFSEDCLFLNLFRPVFPLNTSTAPAPFPVLVFIHGGGYAVGGTFVEGYANISNNFVSQGILAITIQYRLNFLGFFSDGTARNPGNIGLWDQRQALLWIRQNVANFGGHPGRITVWGQSAGASSLSLLSISPRTRDLFHQAIQISGSFLSPWALNNRVVQTAMDTARTLGCAKGGVGEGEEAGKGGQKECLKALELDDMVDGIQRMDMVRNDFAMVLYNPRVDDDFISRDFGRALSLAPKKPTLMGFNPHESLFLTIHYPVSVFAFDSPLTVPNLTDYNRDQLVKFIRSCIQINSRRGGGGGGNGKEEAEQQKQISDQLEEFYAGAIEPNGNNETALWRRYLEQYTLLLSDIQFIVPFLAEARLKAEHGWPIYIYQFDHVSREHAKKLPFRGVVHAGEYPYTLGTELFGNYGLDEEDRRVQATLLRAFGNFIKTGKPAADWPPVTGKGAMGEWPLRMMRFAGPKVRFETNPTGLTRRIQFWRKLAHLKGYSRVQGFPRVVP